MGCWVKRFRFYIDVWMLQGPLASLSSPAKTSQHHTQSLSMNGRVVSCPVSKTKKNTDWVSVSNLLPSGQIYRTTTGNTSAAVYVLAALSALNKMPQWQWALGTQDESYKYHVLSVFVLYVVVFQCVDIYTKLELNNYFNKYINNNSEPKGKKNE